MKTGRQARTAQRAAANSKKMKITATLTIRGTELSIRRVAPCPLEPCPDANQRNPRRYYVYAHVDPSGKIFYVGKGKGRRAWSIDRHPLWHRYVEKHLAGQYEVRILQDNLPEEECEEVEAAWIAQCSNYLVNWISAGRNLDLQALKRYHKLRDANRGLIAQAKTVEKGNLEQAVEMYVQAIEAIKEYSSISYEEGLVGQLLREEEVEFGKCGEIEALDRLTLCLVKLKKQGEAAKHVNSYFTLYRRDMQRAAYQRIAKRIARSGLGKSAPDSSFGTSTEKR